MSQLDGILKGSPCSSLTMPLTGLLAFAVPGPKPGGCALYRLSAGGVKTEAYEVYVPDNIGIEVAWLVTWSSPGRGEGLEEE